MDFRTLMGLRLLELEEQRLRADQLLLVLKEVSVGNLKPSQIQVNLSVNTCTVLTEITPLLPPSNDEKEKESSHANDNHRSEANGTTARDRLSIG